MNTGRLLQMATVMTIIVVLTGCTSYVVTQKLEEPIGSAAICQVGEIRVGLPPDVEEDDLPPEEDILQFRSFLQQELARKELFRRVGLTESDPDCEVTGTLFAYRRGSGAARFFIGFGVGNAKMTIEMKLTRISDGELMFAGNFTREVSSGVESGIEMYKRVAKDFAKELSKQVKKLE